MSKTPKLVQGASALAVSLADARLDGPFVMLLNGPDGERFEEVFGKEVPVTTDENGTKTATTGGITFMFGNIAFDGGAF